MTTILLVEDDEQMRRLVKLMLTRDGFNVSTAVDGPTALKKFDEQQYDLVICDIMLLGMDGLDVTRRIRDISDIPILILSARATDEDHQAGLLSGANEYLTKPVSPRELTATVRRLLPPSPAP